MLLEANGLCFIGGDDRSPLACLRERRGERKQIGEIAAVQQAICAIETIIAE